MAAQAPEHGEYGSSRLWLAVLLESLETGLRTAVAVVVVPLALLGYSLVALALAGAPPARTHRIYVSFARLCLRIGGTRLRVRGAERIEPDTAYVVVPNHDSGWDPMCVVAGLPGLVMRFVTKHEFMRIPILGQALRLTGNVEVLRSETQADVERIRAAMGQRDPSVSILFFAEGTRSCDGALHPFKAGAFATAIGYGLPVLPIGLAGTRHIWQRSVVRLRRGSVALEVGEPIPVEGLCHDDRGALREQTFTAVVGLRAQARQQLRDEGVDSGGIE